MKMLQIPSAVHAFLYLRFYSMCRSRNRVHQKVAFYKLKQPEPASFAQRFQQQKREPGIRRGPRPGPKLNSGVNPGPEVVPRA